MSAEDDNGGLEEPEILVLEGSEELETLRAEVAALKDRSLRALAETENVRKRAERDRDELRQYAVTHFARDMLTVADNLSRALTACSPEARASADESLQAVMDGVEATERELQGILAQHGVKPVAATGARFDPHLHQAIAEVPAGNNPPGTVVEVVQGGYTIGERLLRPAMVTVAKAEIRDATGHNGTGSSSTGEQLDTKV